MQLLQDSKLLRWTQIDWEFHRCKRQTLQTLKLVSLHFSLT